MSICNRLNMMRLPDKCRWLPLQPSDLVTLDGDISDDTMRRVIDNAAAGAAATLWVNGSPLCSVGVADRRGGVGEAWAVIDKTLRHKYPLLLTRAVRGGLYITVQSLRLQLVHMYIESGRTDAMRWAMTLGFRHEGDLVFHNAPELNHHIFTRRF